MVLDFWTPWSMHPYDAWWREIFSFEFSFHWVSYGVFLTVEVFGFGVNLGIN